MSETHLQDALDTLKQLVFVLLLSVMLFWNI